VLVMGMITIMLIMGTTFLAVKGYQQKLGLNHKDSIQAQFLAEAGVGLAIDQLKTMAGWTGSLGPSGYFGGTVTVDCYDGFISEEAIVVSTGTYGSAGKTVTVSIMVPGR